MLLRKPLILNLLFLLMAAGLLSSCGYQPLHGKRQTAQNTAMRDELATIWVSEIKDREGQQLHNELLDRFNIKGRPQHPKYTLKVTYSESSSGLGVGKDEFATRANLYVTSTFSLSGTASLSGTSQSVVSYNILTSPTGTEFARRDARKRAIRSIATNIHRRVTVHLLNEKAAATSR